MKGYYLVRNKNFIKNSRHKLQCSFLRYLVIEILNHSINFESCERVLTQKVEYSFEYVFLNLKSFSQERDQLIDIAMDNICSKKFAWFEGDCILNPGCFLVSQPTLKNNYDELVVFYFLKVCIETIKINKGSSPNFVSNIKRIEVT